jgi:hypothetical protein
VSAVTAVQAPVNLGCFEAVGFKLVYGYGDEDYVLVRDAKGKHDDSFQQ